MAGTSVWPRGAPQVGQKAARSRRIKPEFIRLFTEISGDRSYTMALGVA